MSKTLPPFQHARLLLRNLQIDFSMQNANKAKIDSARPNKESPQNDRFRALIAEQNSIREQQKSNKSSRTAQQEKYTAGEAQLKAMITEQKNARSRVGFKNVEEIDAQIDRLMKQVDSGSMKLVDEKKALAEVSSLRKQRKGFSGFDDMQKRIDQKKSEITDLKKTFDNPESRALSQKYEDNQKELAEIKATREDVNKNLDSLKAEREKFVNEEKAAYAKIREIKDTYYQLRKANKEYDDMVYQQRRERQKAERDAYEKEKRKKIATGKLEDASAPAYWEEIETTERLIRYFDPASAVSDSSTGPGKFAATAQRTVEDSSMKGMKVMKKDEEDFFVGGGGKKKGKGKKTSASGAGTGTATDGAKFNINYKTIEELQKVGVDPPGNQSEVPVIVEKLKEKLEGWKQDQDRQTKVVCISAQCYAERRH